MMTRGGTTSPPPRRTHLCEKSPPASKKSPPTPAARVIAPAHRDDAGVSGAHRGRIVTSVHMRRIDPIVVVAEVRGLMSKALAACRQGGLIVDVHDIERHLDDVEIRALTITTGMAARALVREALGIGRDLEARCAQAQARLN
jgi:hypothetical protein